MDISGDIHLIVRFKNGDESAFNELVRKYMNIAYNIAYGIVGNCEDAKDISQDAFLKVYNSINKFRENSKFYTWFYRIIVNTSLNYIRGNKMLFIDFQDKDINLVIDKSFGPAEKLEGFRIRDKIEKVLSRLSPKQKIVFELKNYQGLSLKEISEIMNCSIGTVKSHLFRAVKYLKDNISPYLEGNNS